jgi:hypothetical protein
VRALSWAAAAAASVSVAACHHGASPAPGADGAPPASAVASTFPAVPAAPLGPPRARDRSALKCRIIALEGKAVAETEGDAGPLALQQGLPDGWLDVGGATRLVVKDPRTTRETTFRGPGRVRGCVGAVEESWVALGAFESTAGAGEAPGAEEWVVTPHAVVRYASAKLRADVRPTGTTVTMVAGVAFLWPPAPAARTPGAHHDEVALDEGWQRLPMGDGTAARGGAPGEAVDRCAALAERSRALTVSLFSAEGGTPSGATVTEQVTTRRLARAACALAELRVQTAAPGDRADAATAAWAARLAEADAAWRSLPVAAASP